MPETRFGGGVRIQGVASDSDLTYDLGPGFSDGQVGSGEWFFHGTYDGGDDAMRLPVRFGIDLHRLQMDFPFVGLFPTRSVAYRSVGPRVEFAPEIPVSENGSNRICVTGLLGLGYSLTDIETNQTSTEWETEAVFLDIGFGMRASFAKAYADLGYRYLSTRYDRSEPSDGTYFDEAEASFSGLVLGFGFKF